MNVIDVSKSSYPELLKFLRDDLYCYCYLKLGRYQLANQYFQSSYALTESQLTGFRYNQLISWVTLSLESFNNEDVLKEKLETAVAKSESSYFDPIASTLLAKLSFYKGDLSQTLLILKRYLAQRQDLENHKHMGLLLSEISKYECLLKGEESLHSFFSDSFTGKDLKAKIDKRVQCDFIRELADKNLLGILFLHPDIRSTGNKILFFHSERAFLLKHNNKLSFSADLPSRDFSFLTSWFKAGSLSRNDIANEIWGRDIVNAHDLDAIYNYVFQLKKKVSGISEICQWRDSFLILTDEIKVRNLNLPKLKTNLAEFKPTIDSRLNVRQMLYLKSREKITSIKAYQTKFQVSRNTATRDLKDLETFGLCQGIGKGPSRRYLCP